MPRVTALDEGTVGTGNEQGKSEKFVEKEKEGKKSKTSGFAYKLIKLYIFHLMSIHCRVLFNSSFFFLNAFVTSTFLLNAKR